MNGQSLAVTSDWLNAVDNYTPTSTSGRVITYGSTFQTYPAYPTYYYWTTPAPRPIRLSMSEVERLRKAAKTDDKLKAILAKFTAQIEVIVDFE